MENENIRQRKIMKSLKSEKKIKYTLKDLEYKRKN